MAILIVITIIFILVGAYVDRPFTSERQARLDAAAAIGAAGAVIALCSLGTLMGWL